MCAGFEVGGYNVARSFLHDATATAALVGSFYPSCELRHTHLTKYLSTSESAWKTLSALRTDCAKTKPNQELKGVRERVLV